ncbi:hypothetical protein Tco_0307686 [Tanacetum coccineum]
MYILANIIDPKDKGKKVLKEEAESEAESEGVNEAKRKFAQLANDEEIARKVQEEWETEEEKKKLAEEEATKALSHYATGSREEKGKAEMLGVKNSILTPGGEKKRRFHWIGEIRKKILDNICEGKIMAVLKG